MTRARASSARTPGVTALIHHDPSRGRRTAAAQPGQRPALSESVWINSRVCEGCGDCAEQATCMSLVHVDTEFGTKMSVHQGSCNLDMTCVKGECPSFVIARHRPGPRWRRRFPRHRDPCPTPNTGRGRAPRSSACPGSEGQASSPRQRIMQMAAHLEGLHAAGIDQTGLAQKGGPVTSDIRISSSPITGDAHASPGGADLLLGFDLLGAAGDDALSVASPECTVAVVNVAEVPTASMLRHQGTTYPLFAGLRARIARATRADEMVCLDAQSIAERLTGDHLAANLVLVGAAFQAGLLPFGADALAGRDTPQRRRRASQPGRPRLGACARSPRPRSSPRPSPRWRTRRPGRRPRCRPSSSPRPTGPKDCASWSACGWPSSSVSRTRGWPVPTCGGWRTSAARSGRRPRDPQFPVTESFARGLYALTAVKDEYEVARLHLLDEEQEAFGRAFPGSRRVLPAQAAAAGEPGPAAQDQIGAHGATGLPPPPHRSPPPGHTV